MVTTISTLEEAVCNDSKVHHLKQIAELLIAAMTDWPSSNQITVDDFVDELKEYFGAPIIIEQISAKSFDPSGQNAWRHEAGSSIIDMLKLSEVIYQSLPFDDLVQKICSYYNQAS